MFTHQSLGKTNCRTAIRGDMPEVLRVGQWEGDEDRLFAGDYEALTELVEGQGVERLCRHPIEIAMKGIGSRRIEWIISGDRRKGDPSVSIDDARETASGKLGTQFF